ncbi:TD and POZ domain-containing protein 1-like [Parasteatoda tepidariorum]|uniref:TD and POZ domain-containing protein 1-like n=1 Tax=Parasteatoda tepidariorum TaxID=114398 RepID=UPI001C71AE4E|nr:TD and POZ domain-containing protein 1-like [Parasteatoda tepidariorum]
MAKNEYEGDWTISTPANPIEFKTIVTPAFAPFSDKNLTYCFEAWYQEVQHNTVLYLFKLKLVKLSNDNIAPILKVSVDVNYSNGTIFKNYPTKMVFNDGSNYVTFEDVTRAQLINGYESEHFLKMRSNTLIIKCKMKILHQDQTLHITTGDERKSSKCVDFIRNLKSIYEHSVLSDFVFKVGDKSFHVHKNILAAHSPVFMKMMTDDFMESKTNSVTITYATPEVFELFLISLYTGELENKTWDSLKELYYLVDKYDVEFLKVECIDAVISLLSVDLVCEILKLAYSFSNSDLKTAAINFAVNHIKEIVPREDWKELVKTHPMIGYDVIVNFIPK